MGIRTAILIVLLCSGCATTYKGERCIGTGAEQVCLSGEVKTRRSFEQLRFFLDIENGIMELTGSKVTTHVSPLEQAAAEMILRLPVPE